MKEYIAIGKRFIARREIAFVEAFDGDANPTFKPTKKFAGRVVLSNRDSVLIEIPPEAFAEANGLAMLPSDRVGINPLLHFQVEAFTPVDGFQPVRPYTTRLRWRDLDENEQSKLLLTEPEAVLACMIGCAGKKPDARLNPQRKASSGRRRTSTKSYSLSP